MPAMLSFIRECGITTVGSKARFALRIRASMSEIGSFIISLKFFYGLHATYDWSPTGLGDAGDQPIERPFAEGKARAGELAQVATATAAHRAAIHHARRAGVA